MHSTAPLIRRAWPRTIINAVTLLAAASVVSATPVAAQEVFELETIAPGVIVADVLPNPAAYAFANSLIVIGEDGVLVVDTQQSLTAAEALIAEIRRLTDLPVRWVVNTHFHGDHVYGNQVYAAAYPDVQFIAHVTTAEDMATLGVERRERELVELPVSIAARQQWLASGVGPDSTPLSGASRAGVERSLALRTAYLAELERIVPTMPTILVEDSLELRVGRRRVLVMHVGPAHTRGDLIVFLPDERVVAVGDIVEAGMPWFEDAAPAGWLSALQRIAALDATTLVPSHGPIQRDDALLTLQLRLLDAVLERAAGSAAATPAAQAAWTDLARIYEESYGIGDAPFAEAVELAVTRATNARR